MSRSRARLAADWFAKLRQNAVTNAVEHIDVTDVSADVVTNAYSETVFAVTGTTPALDPANGGIQTWTLSNQSNPTDSFSAGESMTLMVEASGPLIATYGSGNLVVWPTMQWSGGAAPELATTGYSVIVLWKVGTTLYGASAGDMS
ncbi:hypothetical protein N9796_00355 [bacterium]|nr:hypothetical protein [bacterium]MDB4277773.1 hypothetical protein [Gammaproteobacteria bacterium]MDB4352536.1 hypothetical protein [Porticoccaceae bacterium]